MKPFAVFLTLVLFVMPVSLIAEGPTESSNRPAEEAISGDGWGVTVSHPNRPEAVLHPFSLGATMESVSSLGGQFQFATNITRHMNLRSNFDLFMWKHWITYQGFTADARMSMMSNNTSLDFYPFPNHGLRFSPGVLIHNPSPGNGEIFLAPGGGPFTVNGHTYYSAKFTTPSNPDPRVPNTNLGPAWAYEEVDLRKTAFTMSTGWGNMIPRKSGPWSFPFELGVAFLGSPAVNLKESAGDVCDAQGQNCSPVVKNPQLQSDIQAEFGAYKSHLDLLKTYPIVSFGVAYSFDLRTKAPY